MKHIDELCASADTQHGNPDSLRLFQQKLICRIPRPVITGTDLRLLAITFGMDMGAPRKYQPVQQRNIHAAAGPDVVGPCALQPEPKAD